MLTSSFSSTIWHAGWVIPDMIDGSMRYRMGRRERRREGGKEEYGRCENANIDRCVSSIYL